MYNSISLDNALSVPYPDIVALSQGRMITIITHVDMYLGRSFALYPVNTLLNLFPVEEYYKSSFLSTCKTVLDEINFDEVEIKLWGKCHNCSQVNDPEDLTKLSKVTPWTEEGLKALLQQRGNIFLTYLRVYKLPEPITVSSVNSSRFIPLPHSITVTETNPILDDHKFEHLYRKILNRQPPEHPELEELETAIAQFQTNSLSQEEQLGLNLLQANIHQLLGWKTSKPANLTNDSSLNWINEIAAFGNRSKELDEGKSNYQAGTDFENIVKQSLEFLGFTIDYAHKGGAGGLDLFCSKPYPIVGECKAGKKTPNDTAVQLLNLGTLRLKDEKLFKDAIKLIIGPSEPTQQMNEAAKVHKMTIINPETLEKLVKLQAQYPGSVDLIELKDYFKKKKGDQEEWGQMDDNIDKYIKIVFNRLQLRSHIIKVVKDYLNNAQMAEATVSGIHGRYCSNQPQFLSERELHEILVELSSPLAGYVGRKKAEDWRNDRFYYLRELIVHQS
ncbi:conserved hypothetical protein [Planktothrix sp. PCC 11201]|uniref:DUF1802 family protein n=1 Tax=Planktothrix sp. PCC 11201 TaxID=1729650 RepID=UPI0009152368|nr:DUF1802 family protein [Planktothrix sp. PCC 11201]SKB14062.1 conserved hypothetical protein [Planktothrix sp. PCC 11201]